MAKVSSTQLEFGVGTYYSESSREVSLNFVFLDQDGQQFARVPLLPPLLPTIMLPSPVSFRPHSTCKSKTKMNLHTRQRTQTSKSNVACQLYNGRLPYHYDQMNHYAYVTLPFSMYHHTKCMVRSHIYRPYLARRTSHSSVGVRRRSDTEVAYHKTVKVFAVTRACRDRGSAVSRQNNLSSRRPPLPAKSSAQHRRRTE